MGGGPAAPIEVLAPIDILSISTTASPAPPFVPFAQPDVGSSVSVLGDSLSDSLTPAPAIPPPVTMTIPPPATTPVVLTIKDKASDLGIKDVTDKVSWIEAKKIIDARLRRHPYSPGPDSKVLVTTTANTPRQARGGRKSSIFTSNPQSLICSSRNPNSTVKVSR
jgi:hypothetical protein